MHISRVFSFLPALGLLALAGITMVVLPLPAYAQQQNPENPWVVNCSSAGTGGELKCQMMQTIFLAKTKQRILAVVIFRKKDSPVLLMRVGLPHGIYLPAGLNISVDGKSLDKYLIENADENGSYANISLVDDLMAVLKNGNKIEFSMLNLEKDSVNITISLKGFATSIDSLK